MGNSPADCSLGGPATARGVPALPARRHWAMLLTPTPEPGRPAVPDDALQVFARIGWSVPVDRVRGRTLSVVTESSLDVDRGVRHRDRRRGHRPSRRHAGGLGAARLPLAPGVGGTGFGTRQLPAAPVPTGERAYGDVVVTRDRVATFVAATGIDHPLHADLAHCRGMGFDDVVVQGLELVDDVVRSSGASIGTVEAWFRKPVVAGETVALGSADDGVWTMRAAGGELAADRARRVLRSRHHPARGRRRDRRHRACRRTAARDPRLPDALPQSLGSVDGRRRRRPGGRSRPDARDRRRVGLRQDRAGAVDHGPARRSRGRARGVRALQRRRAGRRPAGHGAGPARHADGDDLPGPAHGPQPGGQDRTPADRGPARPPGRLAAATPATSPSSWCERSASPSRLADWTSTPTRCRAGCASGS